MEINRDIEAGRYPILVVDEDGENLEFFRTNFRDKYVLFTAGSVEEAVAVLDSHAIALAIVEYSVSNQKGIEVLAQARHIQPDIVGILMSENTSSDFFIEAINSGEVWKFVLKPWDVEDMDVLLDEALKIYSESLKEKTRVESLHETKSYYTKEIIQNGGFDDFVIGQDGDLADVMERVRKVAASPMPVLLRGERGVGKEMIARALHHLGDRAQAPFVKLNAATSPGNTIEEELFGKDDHSHGVVKGHAELAEGGTLFVENVHTLSPEAQFRLAELLRAGEFERVDGSRQVKVDVRVIATTTGNLEEMVAARTFRKDLLDMLAAFPIDVPPLRERPRDITALAKFFANKAAKALGLGSVRFDDAAVERIARHDWPGNLWELVNVVQLATLHCREEIIRASDIGPLIRTGVHAAETSTGTKKQPDRAMEGNLKNRLADIERDQIVEALKKAGGKKALAARMLGINRSTLYYRMRKFGLSYQLSSTERNT